MKQGFLSSSPADTLEIAGVLGSVLFPGDVVALTGELGAGKTIFCKGIGEALGIPPERVVSPSFTIVSEHDGRVKLFHMDAYRLASEREALDMGLDEIMGGDGVTLVEWADRIESLLPNGCIKVEFHVLKGDDRLIALAVGDESRFRDFLARCERFIRRGGDS